MTRQISWLLLGALLCLFFALPSAAETIKCSECGMISDMGSRFSSRITNADKTIYFCDIGDMLSYVNAKKPYAGGRIEVRDYGTGEWIEGRAALYVHADGKLKSPMGWSIASFKDKKTAAQFGSVMDFDSAAKAVR